MSRVFAAVMSAVWFLTAAPAGVAAPPPPLIVHAGKADSLNHALAMQFAEALAQGNNALTVQVEESQGSVQNIIDVTHRGGNYIFTTAPNLIIQARRGEKPFARNIRYHQIRALFPIPPLTMHWLVRADSGVTNFAGLAGQPFAPGGKGSFSERQTASMLHALGLERRVQLIDVDAAGAKAAMTGKQVVGVALAGTFPMPAVNELAKTVPVALLSLTHSELVKVLAADDSIVPQVIPKDTYPGIDENVTTVALPAGAYTTTRMSNSMAYAVTKAFWSQKMALAARNPAWKAVTAATLAKLGIRLHPGALRYYREAGVKIPRTLR